MASIQTVYVALFGRPADPTGLNFFNGVTNNGADLTAIGDLAATAEYQARFAGQTNAQIITSIYQSLFDRNPEQAGLDFFVQALANGTFNINNIAIAIADGAQGDDLTLLNKKVAAADLFTAAIDTPDEIASYQGTAAGQQGIDFLEAVTSTSTVVDAAAAQTAVSGLPTNATGQTFTLTTGQDTPAGTSGADTINGVSTGAIATSTLQVSDVINGGGGDDILNISSVAPAGGNAMGAGTLPTLSSIETVNVTSVGAGATTFDSTFAPQATHMNSVGSTQNTTFFNVALNGQQFGMSGNASADDLIVNLASGDTGTKDALTLNLGGNGGADDVIINGSTTAAGNGGIEILNINSTGGANTFDQIISQDTAPVNVLKNVVVKGDQNLTAVNTGAGANGSFTLVSGGSYDGSALAAVNNVSINGAAGAVTVTGGAKDDRFLLDTIGATDILDGGASSKNDTIGIFNGGANGVAAGGLAGTKNFENFEIADDITAQDVDNIGAFSLYTVSSVDASAGFFDLGNGANTAITGNATGTTGLELKTNSVVDSLNLSLNNGTGAAQLINEVDIDADAGGVVETVNITVGSPGGGVTVTVNDIQARDINVTGSDNLDISELLDGVLSFDASKATGNITVEAAAGSADASSIQTGSGNDTVTLQGGAGGDVSAATGAGNDTIIVAAAEDHSLTAGDGADTIRFNDLATLHVQGDTIATADETLTITDFVSGTDAIQLANAQFALGVGALGAGEYVEFSLASTAATMGQVEAAALAAGVADNTDYIAAVQIGANVHLFYDADHTGPNGASEFAILTGVDLSGIAATDFTVV